MVQLGVGICLIVIALVYTHALVTKREFPRSAQIAATFAIFTLGLTTIALHYGW